MSAGIDIIEFSTSKYFFKLKTLAKHRNEDYAKYYSGIGQELMSVFPPNEDIVTLGIAAAEKALEKIENKNSIDMLIFASESAFDLSKSEGIYIHKFLELKNDCRVFNIKQACYSATAALQLAKNYVECNPKSKVLIVSSDIVKYSSDSSGEPTQGGAAVAMVISQNPRILSLEPFSSVYTTDVMDFWRPTYKEEALFDGKLSAYNYLKSLEITFSEFLKKSALSKSDIDRFCFHCPFCKVVKKAAKQVGNIDVEKTLIYNRIIGNSCSSSLYVSFISLLDHENEDLSEKRIGFFSYGSGSVAEFFSGCMVQGYKNLLSSEENRNSLSSRLEISFDEYEAFRKNEPISKNYENIGNVKLSGMIEDKKNYEKISRLSDI